MPEQVIMRYLAVTQKEARSNFIGKSLARVLKFTKYVMGFDLDLGSILGPIITGKMSRILAAGEPTEQPRPLSVEAVKRLDTMLAFPPNKLDRYFVGCLLLALYSRS